MLCTVVAGISIEPNATCLLCSSAGLNMPVQGSVEAFSTVIWVHENALYPPQLGVAPGDSIDAQIQIVNGHSFVTVRTA